MSLIVSLHWGRNWGYEIPAAQRRFAHRLIDAAGRPRARAFVAPPGRAGECIATA
jgi:hypothetical protein